MKVAVYVLLLSIVNFAYAQADWIKNHPASESNYVGIAKVSKKTYPNTYQEKALDLALSFLSSEIKVSVESIVNDISKDTNGEIYLAFDANTVTVTKEDVEGYKLVDTWENRKEYAVYCVLSKSTYLDNKRKKFIGTFKLLNDKYDYIQTLIEKRDFSSVLINSYKLRYESANLIKTPEVLPYMTSFEIEDLSNFNSLYDSVLSNSHIEVKAENILPFSWTNSDNLKIRLVDVNNKSWKNWKGILIKDEEEIHVFEKQNESMLDFPINVFLYNNADATYELALIDPNKKTDDVIRRMAFTIPFSASAKLGKITVNNIPKNLKRELVDTVNLFFANANETKGNASSVDVTVSYEKVFESSGWITGKLRISLSNRSISKKTTGTGVVEVSCKGNTIEQTVKNGFKDIREAIIEDNIQWR